MQRILCSVKLEKTSKLIEIDLTFSLKAFIIDNNDENDFKNDDYKFLNIQR